MKHKALAAIAVALLVGGPGKARTKPVQSPLVQALGSCEALTDAVARLACYDRAAVALTKAAIQGKIVIVDQQDLKEGRKQLFGFSLPKLPFLSSGDSASDNPDEIAANIASSQDIGDGKWRITIDSGAVWETLEASWSGRDPRAGNPIVIKRGALGSYMMRIDGRRGIRARRIG
jgi:hypothetical protein